MILILLILSLLYNMLFYILDLGTFHCYHFYPYVYCCYMVLLCFIWFGEQFECALAAQSCAGRSWSAANSATSRLFLCRHTNSFQPGRSVGCSSISMDIQDPGKNANERGSVQCITSYHNCSRCITSKCIASHCHIVMIV